MIGGEYKSRGWRDFSFSEFVNFVLTESRQEQDLLFLKMNVHWRPMSAHGFFCSINYTVISKMETYDEDKKRFLEMVGFTEEINEGRFHVHGGKSIQEKTKAMFRNIKEEDFEELTKLYKYDLELFDYDPHMY